MPGHEEQAVNPRWLWPFVITCTLISVAISGASIITSTENRDDARRAERLVEQYRLAVRACAAATNDHDAFYRCVREVTP
jgi:hypothetical protein